MICQGDLLGVVNSKEVTSKWKVISFNEEGGTMKVECTMSAYQKHPTIGEIQEGLVSKVKEGIEEGRVIYIENALVRLKRRYRSNAI